MVNEQVSSFEQISNGDLENSKVLLEKLSFEVEIQASLKTSLEDNYYKGVFYIVIAMWWYTFMALFSKILYVINPEMSAWDIVFIRGVLSTFILAVKAKSEGVNVFDLKESKVLVLVGSIFPLCSYIFILISYQYISITKATLLIYSNPIIVVVIAYFALKENITKADIGSIFAVIIGTIITTANSDETSLNGNPFIGYLLAGASWFTQAMTVIVQRQACQIGSFYIIPFYMCLYMLPISFYLYFFTDKINLVAYGFLEYLLMVGCTISGLLGLIFSNLWYKFASATKLAPYWNLEVVFLFVFEYLFFNYAFTMLDIFGGLLILGGLMLGFLFN